jgi:2-dehydro-3-deoxyphosphogluconate aldolase/(4S)-4-hydroxy-2-oxoglutarate aldolase
MRDIASILEQAVVIPVLTVEHSSDAAPLARALVAGGLHVLEVTLRTPAARESIRAMKAEVPEALVGAGTVLNLEQLDDTHNAGADFFVSPGSSETLLREAASRRLPFLPGVATATEAMRGLDAGFSHFKFFPAQQLGGPAALNAFAGPLPQCRFCPTGGITSENARNYLALDNVVCVGGTWIAPPDLIAKGDWSAITERAAAAHRLGEHRSKGRA